MTLVISIESGQILWVQIQVRAVGSVSFVAYEVDVESCVNQVKPEIVAIGYMMPPAFGPDEVSGGRTVAPLRKIKAASINMRPLVCPFSRNSAPCCGFNRLTQHRAEDGRKILLGSVHMRQTIATIAYVVSDYDEAIQFFVETLGFDLVEDTCLEQEQPGKRWVVVRPKGSVGCSLLLAKAVGDAQLSAVGNQSGGRVFLFLHTDDFWRDYTAMKDKSIVFTAPPRQEAYGVVAVFLDLYGNKWDLIQPSKD